MKARVKATGEIVEVKSKVITSPCTGNTILKYVDQKKGISYFEEDLFFPKDFADDPDYWTRLEHTYVGMFMKSFLDNFDCTATMEQLSDDAIALAHALVQKLKEKEERK